MLAFFPVLASPVISVNATTETEAICSNGPVESIILITLSEEESNVDRIQANVEVGIVNPH